MFFLIYRGTLFKWISIVFILSNNKLVSQVNLVPNKSFENYTFCPSNIDDICKATPWFQPINCAAPWGVCQCGSSNIFNVCMDPFSGGGSVPNNDPGHQFPKSGNAYAGIATYAGYWAPDLWREYLEVKLINVLISNKKYCISWYSNLADGSYIRYASNNIGVHFTNDTLFQTGSQFNYIPVIPHVENFEIVVDTVNWVLFKQIYTAQGFENFMTFGNFRPGSNTDTIVVQNVDGFSYYYFDDFGVYELPEITAGNDAEICEYGGSAQLQASCQGCWDALHYRWWPSVGLSDSTILNPLASPEQTTTYYFGLIDTTETVPCIVDLVDSVTVTVCEGITPPPFNFTIQPNPGSDKVELVFTHVSEDTELFLYDMRGRIVFNDHILKDSKSYTLDLSHLANAQYMLKLQNSSAPLRKKLMKM